MKFSISDLEQLSGVPSHTIRIWERRYHALEPMRSAGNTRFYDNDQLRKLLNIVSLNQSGLKISQVCSLSETEIDQLLKKEIDQTISAVAQYEYYISQLLKFGLAYNELKFDEIINLCIVQHGIKTTYQSVIYPLLMRIGLMWRMDHICPAQEHFVSAIIKQKLMVAISQIPLKTQTKSTWLLFLPEDEEHDIGLLFANYVLRQAGHKVIYLGSRVPFGSVQDAMLNNNISNILLFMVRLRPTVEADHYLNSLSKTFATTQIHLAGNSKLIDNLQLANNINWFKSIAALELAIKNLLHAN